MNNDDYTYFNRSSRSKIPMNNDEIIHLTAKQLFCGIGKLRDRAGFGFYNDDHSFSKLRCSKYTKFSRP